MQAGYTCLGVCEIDPVCQKVCSLYLAAVKSWVPPDIHTYVVQVLALQYPDLPQHDDLLSLDLDLAIPPEKWLDVVVISTPCTNVSSRGHGEAEQGTVCSAADGPTTSLSLYE